MPHCNSRSWSGWNGSLRATDVFLQTVFQNLELQNCFAEPLVLMCPKGSWVNNITNFNLSNIFQSHLILFFSRIIYVR